MSSSDNVVKLPLPVEVLFADFCDFRDLEQKYLKDVDNVDSLSFLLQSLECLYKQSFLKLTVQEVIQLYNFTVTAINSYKSTELSELEINGETYVANVEEVSAGEALTILEFSRLYEKKAVEKVYDANIDFNLGLEEIAVLYKKRGEYLPLLPKARIKFIDERKQLFAKHVKLYQILDLRFFFIRKYPKYMSHRNMSHFLKVLTDTSLQSLRTTLKDYEKTKSSKKKRRTTTSRNTGGLRY